ncbi:MAG: hypothetical protein LBR10_01975 [Prevotellaceae bacterium]|jgi:hypothetical protein|nr:hypothetical protein [Prevotellaceae bacterium]
MNNLIISETLKTWMNRNAWDELSGDSTFSWTPKMIDKHAGDINWNNLSGNSAIFWSVDTISKHKDLINWSSLSCNLFNDNDKVFYINHIEIVRKFSDRLDWKELSQSYLPAHREYLKEFFAHWDWEDITENSNINWDDALINEFMDKILPYCPFDYDRRCRGSLWSHIFNMEICELKAKLLSEA